MVIDNCNTKQHYLTYISIISRGLSSSGSNESLHTLNSILSVIVSFNIIRKNGM